MTSQAAMTYGIRRTPLLQPEKEAPPSRWMRIRRYGEASSAAHERPPEL